MSNPGISSKKHTNSACNNVEAVKFVQAFLDDAKTLADQVGVPVENILGLAAQESQYGSGRIASEYNNYFSMHAPAKFQVRAEPALKDPKIKVAVFKSFLDSGQSFLAKFGENIRGKTVPSEFASALVLAGFNSGKAATGGRDHFAKYLTDIIHMVKLRMDCPPLK